MVSARTQEQIDLLERVKDQIRNRPENWNQGSWLAPRTFTRPEEERDELCGTTMCTAGWTLVEAKYALPVWSTIWDGFENSKHLEWQRLGHGDVIRASATPGIAQELLGLTAYQSDALFYATGVSDPDIMCNLIDWVVSWREGDTFPDDYQEKYQLICDGERILESA